MNRRWIFLPLKSFPCVECVGLLYYYSLYIPLWSLPSVSAAVVLLFHTCRYRHKYNLLHTDVTKGQPFSVLKGHYGNDKWHSWFSSSLVLPSSTLWISSSVSSSDCSVARATNLWCSIWCPVQQWHVDGTVWVIQESSQNSQEEIAEISQFGCCASITLPLTLSLTSGGYHM